MTSTDSARSIDRLQATLVLDEPTTRIPGVSSNRASALAKMGVKTIRDMLAHYPRRYMDLTKVRTTATAQIGEQCTIVGQVHEVKLKRPRYNLPIVEITLVDSSGAMIVSVFHQPWLKDKLKPGQKLMVAGKAEFSYGFLRMTNPFLEVADDEAACGRIIPIHHATAKLPAAIVRKIESAALELTSGMYDPIPLEVRRRRGLVSRGSAFRAMHFPKSMDEVGEARLRLVYEELLFLQLFLMQEAEKRSIGKEATSHVTDGAAFRAMDAALPFALTSEQKAAREDMMCALASPKVASHMIIGDVGCGKTVVCAFGFASAVDSGGQGMLLAPTEVLAMQHDRTLGGLFEASGISHALLTGSTAKADREETLRSFADGSLDVLIGTHALLEDDVAPRNLTFVAIDEQQRFGVNQRAKALSKGAAPDALFMTATPIPRSLALTLFGDLSTSYIREKPNVEGVRTTHVVAASARGKAYDGALAALKAGHQAYVVCPLIGVASEERDERAAGRKTHEDANEPYHPTVAIEDESDFRNENLAAAEERAKYLQERVFADYNVGLLHGGMPSEKKSQVMDAFRAGEIDVLVSTTVIEVGVDVPGASVMIVEDADRFGLSQLHQLRGRVGRGGVDSEVYLVSASQQEPALKRLSVLAKSDDGFEIAKHDLSLRREGDILGNRQSGASALKLVNVIRDSGIIEWAHEDARRIIDADPMLQLPENAAMAREVRVMFKEERATLGG